MSTVKVFRPLQGVRAVLRMLRATKTPHAPTTPRAPTTPCPPPAEKEEAPETDPNLYALDPAFSKGIRKACGCEIVLRIDQPGLLRIWCGEQDEDHKLTMWRYGMDIQEWTDIFKGQQMTFWVPLRDGVVIVPNPRWPIPEDHPRSVVKKYAVRQMM
jgi:hypothetical protein